MSSPTPKCVWIDQEQTETAAWVEWQATEASNQLEHISLQESIVWKAWARWEEGMRLAHREWEIGSRKDANRQ